jgi:hypothetical protein
MGKDNDNKDDKNTPVENDTPVNDDKNNSDASSDKTVDDNKDQDNNTVTGLTDKDTIKKDDSDTNEVSGLSNSVVHDTSTNKTPDELSSESPKETAERYGIDNKVTKKDIANPRVQVYSDTVLMQVPSGTHLHPDIAKSAQNYGIAERTTDSAQVKRMITDTYDFAEDAEVNDKF